ncbi:MAG: hypothetical protein ACI9VT_003634, partial [Psychroserpens sp.]
MLHKYKAFNKVPLPLCKPLLRVKLAHFVIFFILLYTPCGAAIKNEV